MKYLLNNKNNQTKKITWKFWHEINTESIALYVDEEISNVYAYIDKKIAELGGNNGY